MADSGAPGSVASGGGGGGPPNRGHPTGTVQVPAAGGHLVSHGRPVHPGAAPPSHSTISKPASNSVIVGGLVNGPRIVILHRYNGDFGFTLRHFIVYPPESITDTTVNPLTIAGVLNFVQPMDTVFVKKVHPNSPAHLAGLQEGDRLLAVNGVPVTSIPYSQVVATIQQTPKTLTLQVVPKNYDILQTFFRETAHNPETNQRPQPQQPYAPKPALMAAGAYPKSKAAPPPPPPRHSLTVEGVQEKQESLYSTLQEIVADNVVPPQPGPKGAVTLHDLPKILNHPAGSATGVPVVPHRMHLQKPLVPMIAPKPVPMPYEQNHFMNLHHQEQQQAQKQQQALQKTLPHSKEGGEPFPVAGDAGYVPLGEGDSVIMSRLRKSLEQKEEFLRRPPGAAQGALAGGPMGPAQPTNNGLPVGHDVQQREFYARPNRLQKSVWPPNAPAAGGSVAMVGYAMPEGNKASTGGLASPPANIVTSSPPSSTGTVSKPSSSIMLREHASQLSAIREHFFTSGIGGSLQMPPKSAPPSLAIAPVAITTTDGPSSPTGGATVPLSPHSMHAVSEKAKLFESGRPLSPEGIDRMDLYKSELSRINTKQVVPNVAVRRKEFELKAESTGWRKSIEDKPRSVSSDSESRRTPVRLRSLSVESNTTRDSRHSLASTLMLTNEPYELNDKDKENQQHQSPPVPMLRQKPIRDDSYRNAVRNSTDGSAPPVVMRQKQPHHPLLPEDDERKMRRISYLRATAHDNLFQMLESDPDSSPMSLPPPDTPDTDATEPPAIESPSLPTTVPHSAAEDSSGPSGKMQPQQLKSHGTKTKALAHFRDGAADNSEPLVREGELHVKVTLIDGKRSADRSWRTVHAELRGHHLKLTLVREGKNSNQSPEPCGTIDLTNFHVTEGNYTKRKNVFKLTTAAGSYCPMEAAAVAGFGHAEVHRTQSASGLANVGGAGSACGSSIRSASTVGLPGSERELLLQADSHSDMQQWMESLRLVCGGGSTSQLHSPDYLSGRGGQQAEPQRIAAQTSVQVHGGSVSGGGNSGDDYSPVLPAKSHRKYALGSRSPSGQSPVTKSRKTPQTGCSSPTGSADQPIVPMSATTNQPTGQYHHQQHHQPHHLTLQQQQHFTGTKDSSDRESGSPKSKTWKGIVARQFRKMQGQPGSPSATGGSDLMALPDGASINVPLQQCPVSEENPYVPLVLAKCTGIVESKGLGVVGIYRIPGNTAAITQLTETINRGLDETALRDARWEDVNVVSSLLKSFIRNLPEPLLPNELYGGFIAADKLSGQRRLTDMRQLLRRVPPMNYETLKHLMRHLYRVSAHSEVNLMDPRNLAIVFGPSVVRSANESLETAVKDMRHQCQIVEVLINNYQYFFEDGLLPSVDESKTGTGTVVDSGLEVPSTSLLLDNVSKIEPFKEQSKESTSGFVANIVQAANRKIRRTAQRKSTMSSTTPDTLSLDSTTSAESKEQSSRVIRRYLELGPKSGTPPSVGAGGDSDRALQTVHNSTGPIAVRGGSRSVGGVGSGEPSTEDSLMQLQHHHHHHHHHYYHGGGGVGGGGRHHSSQSNDDASSVLNRSSEDDSNDSAFADNGSMSLKTVTIALDNKLRSLRDSSIDSDRDQTQESDGDLSSGTAGYGNGRHSLHQQWSSHMGRSPRPLTLGENIPYADESPERPLIQGRAKPQRTLTIVGSNNNNNNNHEDSSVPITPAKQQLKKALTAQSQKSIDSGGTVNSSTNNSCLTLVNEADATLDGTIIVGGEVEGGGGGGGGEVTHEVDENGQQQPTVGKGRNVSLSSDETDTSTTSNPREKLTAATYRIDTEKLKKMNRILTQLERKANNLERKFNLNRSLSLNYKSPKAVDCCCSHHALPVTHSSQPQAQPVAAHCCQHQQQQQQHINNNNSTSCHNHNGSVGGSTIGSTIVSLRSRFSLTKDEKTDKNINRRRQIHDTSATSHPAIGTGNGNASGSNDSSSCSGEPAGPQIILTPAVPPAPAGASGRQRRHVGSRSIRRRHTVGGTHDYYSNKMNGPHHHHHHHHAHHHPHNHHHVGPGCCPVPQN